ncbi:hypothetical protein [Algivirga pacifica]|uniref:Uncharacterized protein n=1 Tax=Algivirga pacifica TaxID=1162670 RepID=A0ABP9DL56_9BACT
MLEYKKDYIERMTEEMVYFLGKLMGMVNAGNNEEALSYMQQRSNDVYPIDYTALNGMSTDGILTLIKENNFNKKVVEMIADLQLLEAQLMEKSTGNVQRKPLERARGLFMYLEVASGEYSFERQFKIEEINLKLL